jgi:hypothetical protein
VSHESDADIDEPTSSFIGSVHHSWLAGALPGSHCSRERLADRSRADYRRKIDIPLPGDQRPPFTEYFLIGTLLSITIAVIGGLSLTALLTICGSS